MCARYRLVRNPDPTGKHKKQALHPRVVPYGTLRVNDLMYQVESRSGLSAGLPQCQLPLREIPEKETENDASRTYAGNPIDSPVL